MCSEFPSPGEHEEGPGLMSPIVSKRKDLDRLPFAFTPQHRFRVRTPHDRG